MRKNKLNIFFKISTFVLLVAVIVLIIANSLVVKERDALKLENDYNKELVEIYEEVDEVTAELVLSGLALNEYMGSFNALYFNVEAGGTIFPSYAKELKNNYVFESNTFKIKMERLTKIYDDNKELFREKDINDMRDVFKEAESKIDTNIKFMEETLKEWENSLVYVY